MLTDGQRSADSSSEQMDVVNRDSEKEDTGPSSLISYHWNCPEHQHKGSSDSAPDLCQDSSSFRTTNTCCSMRHWFSLPSVVFMSTCSSTRSHLRARPTSYSSMSPQCPGLWALHTVCPQVKLNETLTPLLLESGESSQRVAGAKAKAPPLLEGPGTAALLALSPILAPMPVVLPGSQSPRVAEFNPHMPGWGKDRYYP